jgi:hypothetical protein
MFEAQSQSRGTIGELWDLQSAVHNRFDHPCLRAAHDVFTGRQHFRKGWSAGARSD